MNNQIRPSQASWAILDCVDRVQPVRLWLFCASIMWFVDLMVWAEVVLKKHLQTLRGSCVLIRVKTEKVVEKYFLNLVFCLKLKVQLIYIQVNPLLIGNLSQSGFCMAMQVEQFSPDFNIGYETLTKKLPS